MSPNNILILGAGGHLGNVTLRCLNANKQIFSHVYAIDRSLEHLQSQWTHTPKNWSFHELSVSEQNVTKLLRFIHENDIRLVVDLTDAPTEIIGEKIILDGKASYICTAYCYVGKGSPLRRLQKWLKKLPARTRQPHILLTGMNPGVVNVLAAYGIEKFGHPQEITIFEYDSSQWIRHPKSHIVTWSLTQFLAEMTEKPSETVAIHNHIHSTYPNALSYCVPMQQFLSPFIKLRSYPFGCITSHDECLTLAHHFQIPTKFIYTVLPQTMNSLRREIRLGKTHHDILVGDNFTKPLKGTEFIGVALDYEDRRVTYFNKLSNHAVHGINATMYQILVGVLAAISTLASDKLSPKIYFPEDLLHQSYAQCVTDNLIIQEGILRKLQNGRVRTEQVPTRIRIKTKSACLSPEIFLRP